jgi:hypothetical protein
MPQRACDVCGKLYTAQRSTSKYCSVACRVRKFEGAKSVSVAVKSPDSSTGSLAGLTRNELEQAGRLGTALGEAALVLARRIDAGHDPGSAVAALAREHRAALAEAVRGARRAADPMDELKARRERKHAG